MSVITTGLFPKMLVGGGKMRKSAKTRDSDPKPSKKKVVKTDKPKKEKKKGY